MFKNKNILIIGYGKTGQSLENFLKKRNANVYVYEDKVTNNNYQFFYLDKMQSLDFAILSPGFNLSHIIVQTLKQNNIPIYSELDFASNFSQNYIIAITGTNGKTTAVNLLYEILKKSNKKCEICGNVGIPLIDKVSQIKKEILVVEVSSFQLESSKTFKPNISCILNIFPDHISRHQSFSNYKNIKLKINENQNKKDYFILNKNIEINENYYTKSKIIYFDKNNFNSININNNNIYYKNKKIINIDEIKLKGEKNLENIIAVLEICKILKIKNKYIQSVLKDFAGLKHRQEIVLIKDNITYVNDSKGTNVSSTLSAIENFNNIILLLGGSDKGYEYDELMNFEKVKHYIAFGEVKEKIKAAGERNNKQVYCFDKMEQAVLYARQLATSGDTVLLSPASASFDEFSSYEERGNRFAQIIKEL